MGGTADLDIVTSVRFTSVDSQTTHTPYRLYCGRRTHQPGPGIALMEGEHLHLLSDEEDEGNETATSSCVRLLPMCNVSVIRGRCQTSLLPRPCYFVRPGNEASAKRIPILGSA